MRYLPGADPQLLASATAVPLLVLDIDGTVRHGKDQLGRFVNGPTDVIVFEAAVDAMYRWRQRGGRVVGVSNQAGIALGHVSAADVEAAMAETQRQTGDLFDLVLWCQHHPTDGGGCWCRKPRAGMVLRAVWELTAAHRGEHYPPGLALMVGDLPEDRDCARAAGLPFRWASEWRAGDDGSPHPAGGAW